RHAYGKANATDVIRFYTIDGNNPTSIRSFVAYARENARSLRHLISTEMWSQINVFNTWMGGLRTRDVQPRRLPAVCQHIKESCQAHTGITEATFYQDQAWLFYWIGKMIERADQATRLLDVGYARAERVGAMEEEHKEHLSHWNALLRSVGGYHAFRRTHSVRLISHEVVAFILKDKAFPRSVLACVNHAHEHMLALVDQHDVETAKPALGILSDIQSRLMAADSPTIIEQGLHDYADNIQQRLIAFTDALGKGCFGHRS
ncbi:MAG: alpha-E domain-containing protein, partial [Rhodospirillales bacterium]|nr:alpha-E domain-containing protein [Rhodospirillales bacterium]